MYGRKVAKAPKKPPKEKPFNLKKDAQPDKEGVLTRVILPPPRRESPNLFTPVLVDNDQARDEMYDALESASIVAVDTEGTGLRLDRDQIIGVCLAVPPWTTGYYIPMFNSPEGTIWYQDFRTFDRMVAFLKGFLEWDIPKIFHNALYDVPMIYMNLGICVANVAHDTMLRSHILDAEAEHGLKENAVKRIHPEADWYEAEMKRYNEAVGGSAENPKYWLLPADKVAAYGGGDAVFTGRIFDIQERMMIPDLQGVYDEVAMPLTRELFDMRVTGIPLNKAYLQRGHEWFGKRLELITEKIRTSANIPDLNPGSTDQLNDLLFRKLGLKGGRKTKKGYSTDEEEMKRLKGKHPIVDDILEYREVSKLDGTYYKGLLEDLGPDGVFRPDISQIKRTGRLGMSRIHQIPRGPLVRSAFVAPEGFVLVGGDQSQLEARVLAHFSQDRELCKIYKEGRDVHCATAKFMFNLPCEVDEVETLFPEKRQEAKTINFALLYLETVGGLARQLEVSYQEAQALYDAFFKLYRDIPIWAKEEVAIAKRQGYVGMLSGRRRYLPELREFIELPKPPRYPKTRPECFGKSKLQWGGIGLSIEFDLATDLRDWTPKLANDFRPTIQKAGKSACAQCPLLWECYYIAEHKRLRKLLEHEERKALNTKIQGSAADLVGKGIIRTGQLIQQNDYPAHLVIYVHDEVHYLLPVDSQVDAFAKDFGKAMESVSSELTVPLKFKPKVGKSWVDIK